MSQIKQLLSAFLGTSGWIRNERETNFGYIQHMPGWDDLLNLAVQARRQALESLMMVIAFTLDDALRQQSIQSVQQMASEPELDELSIRHTGQTFKELTREAT